MHEIGLDALLKLSNHHYMCLSILDYTQLLFGYIGTSLSSNLLAEFENVQ